MSSFFTGLLKRGKSTKIENPEANIERAQPSSSSSVRRSIPTNVGPNLASRILSVEYGFCNDEIGNQLKVLWQNYFASRESGNQMNNIREFSEYFCTNCDVEISLPYQIERIQSPPSSSSILSSNGKPMVSRDSTNQSVGHPIEMLNEFWVLLFQYIDEAKPTAESTLTEKMSRLSTGSSEISIVRLCHGEDDANVLYLNRLVFLIVLRVISILCRYPYNILYWQETFGFGVWKIVYGILDCVTLRLKNVIELWVTDISQQEKDALQLEAIFLLNCCLVGVQGVSKSCFQVSACASLGSFQIFSPHPWGKTALETYKFPLMRNWLVSESVNTVKNLGHFRLSEFPVFSHPNIRFPHSVCTAVKYLLKLVENCNFIFSVLGGSDANSKLRADITVVQCEALFAIISQFTTSLHLHDDDKKEIGMLWGNCSVNIVSQLNYPSCPLGSTLGNLILQRDFLMLRVNDVFSYLVPVSESSKSFSNMLEVQAKQLIQWLHVDYLRDSVTLYGEAVKNCQGACIAQLQTWVKQITVQATAPGSFVSSYPGVDTWPWCQVSAGDGSFVAPQHNYKICNFPTSDYESTVKSEVKSSYLYLKDSPVFVIASETTQNWLNDSTIVSKLTPPWFSNWEGGKIWALLFQFFNDICFGDSYNNVDKHFSDEKAYLKLEFSFAALVAAVLSTVSDPVVKNVSEFPILQFHFIIFLVRSFKQAPIEAISLCIKTHLLDILLGEYFLRGGIKIISQLFKGKINITQLHDQSFKQFLYSIAYNEQTSSPGQFNLGISWLFLHDACLDFSRCLIGSAANIKKENMAGKSCASGVFLRWKTKYGVLSLLHALNKAYSTTLFADDVVYQLICLLSFTFDDMILGDESIEICKKTLTCCVEIIYKQLEAIGVTSTYPTDTNHHEFVNRVEQKRPFLWASRCAVLKLMLRIMVLAKNEWIDVFLVAPRARDVPSDKFSPVRTMSLSSTSTPSGSESVDVDSPHVHDLLMNRKSQRSDTLSNVSRPVLSAQTPPISTEKSSNKVQMYHQMLSYLLLDPRCKDVAIYVLCKMLICCCTETVLYSSNADNKVDLLKGLDESPKRSEIFSGTSPSVDKAESSPKEASDLGKLRSKPALRVLACDVIQTFLVYVGYTCKHAIWCDSYHTSSCILKYLTGVLRFRKYLPLRVCMQDFFRKGDAFAHVLDVMKNCTKASSGIFLTALANYVASPLCAVYVSSFASTNAELVLQEQKVKILRQGLSLLTAIMSGNSLCKSEFKYVISSISHSRAFSVGSEGSSGAASKMSLMRTRIVGSFEGTSTSQNTGSLKVTRYHNFKVMLLQAEPEPSLTTFFTLLEMMLDGPCLNSKSFLEECSSDLKRVRLGLFANNDERRKIENYAVVPCIISFISCCTVEMQICLINTLHNLCVGKASLVNLSLCTSSSPPLFDLMMDLFPYVADEVQDCIGKLLRTLGKYSLSVAQVKHMFRLLNSGGNYRPAFGWRLLNAFIGMIAGDQGPRHFFVFEGTSSGLKLPPIVKWPAPKSFTYCLWLRATPFENLYESENNLSLRVISADNIRKNTFYNPYIMCFRSQNGQGFEMYMEPKGNSGDYKLVLQTYLENGEKHSYVPDPRRISFTDGEWHFLAVTFSSTTSGFRTKTEVSVMLDTVFAKGVLPIPSFSEPIMEPLIGECLENFKPDAVNTTLRGQMGAVYFFTDALAEGQLRSILALGPDYFYCFEPFSALYSQKNNHVVSRKQVVDAVGSILDGSLTNLVFLAYNPAVFSGDYFLDNTPDKNNIKWKAWINSSKPAVPGPVLGYTVLEPQPIAGRMHAKRILPGTYRSTTQNLRVALSSLGGVNAILPLFAQLDQPRLSVNILSDEGTFVEQIDNSLDPNMSFSVLKLLYSLLDNSLDNQRFLTRNNGPQLIAFFLERVSPLHLSKRVLDVILNLYDRVSWSSAGQNAIIQYLLFNFKLWKFTSFEVQNTILEWLTNFAESKPSMMREIVTPDVLFDDLYLLFGYALPRFVELGSPGREKSKSEDNIVDKQEESRHSESHFDNVKPLSRTYSLNGSIYLSEGWKNPHTGEIVGEKLNLGQKRKLRMYIFHIIKILMTVDDAPYPEDVEALIGYLSRSHTATAKLEGLKLLLLLLNQTDNSSVPSRILLGLVCCKGVLPLISLLEHRCVQVRLYSFICICKVVVLARQIKYLPTLQKSSKYYQLLVSVEANEEMEQGLVVEASPENEVATNDTVPDDFDVGDTDSMDGEVSEDVFDIAEALNEELFTINIEPEVSFDGNIEKFNRNFGYCRKALDLPSSEALGISSKTLMNILLRSQEQLIARIKDDEMIVMENESTEHFELTDGSCNIVIQMFQCQIISIALQLLLLGYSCDHLAIFLENFYANFDPSIHNLENHFVGGLSSSLTAHIELSIQGDVKKELVKFLTPCISEKIVVDIENLKGSKGSISLSDTKILYPVVFPALLLFIKHDIMAAALRLSILVNFKVLLNDENCDKILRIPVWQDYIFQLIAAESVRLSKILTFPDNKRLLDKSQGIVDTCVRILCDITVVAMRIGKPCVGIESLDSEGSLPAFEVMEVVKQLTRGERLLGAAVLKETIALLKIYGERIHCTMRIGNDLLHQTLGQLVSERDNNWVRDEFGIYRIAQNSPFSEAKRGKDNSAGYAEQIFILNSWFLASMVLEIVPVPTYVRVACSQDIEKSTRMSRVEIVSTVFRESKKYCEMPSPEHTESVRFANRDAEINGTEKGEFGKIGDKENFDRVWELLLFLFQLFGPLEELNDDEMFKLAPNLLGYSGNSLSMSSIAWGKFNMSTAAKAVRNLYVSIDSSDTAGSGSGKRVDETSKKLTITVDAITSPSVRKTGRPELFRSPSTNTNTNQFNSPAPKCGCSHVVGGVSWVMIRILLALCDEKETILKSSEKDIGNRSLMSLQYLKNLISNLRGKSVAFVGFEAVLVVVKLVYLLRTTDYDENHQWVIHSLNILDYLLNFQADNLIQLIKLHVSMNLLVNSELSNLNVNVSRKTENMIIAALKLPSVAFSWSIWDAVAETVFEEGKNMEEYLLPEKFTEMGLFRNILEVRSQILTSRSNVYREFRALSRESVNVRNWLLQQQNKRLWNTLRSLNIQSKRCNLRWSKIVSDLANERGPWGSGVNKSSTGEDVFWMLDFVESDRRIRHKLKRNEHGCFHKTASLMQQGLFPSPKAISSVSFAYKETETSESSNPENDTPTLAPSASSNNLTALAKAGETITNQSTAASELWKDLVKYTGKTKNVEIEGKENGGNNSDEEDAAETISAEIMKKPAENVNANFTSLFSLGNDGEKPMVRLNCQVITVASSSSGGTTAGVIEIFKTRIVFTRAVEANDSGYSFVNKTGNTEFQWIALKYPSSTWAMSDVCNIYQRHYQLRFVGIELFFTSRVSIFIDMMDKEAAKLFYYTIVRKIRPPNLVPKLARKPRELIQKTFFGTRTITQAWVNREISNFEYLMHLNTIAGRSFNDLGQYPVFPWVIADYVSKKLDLKNPKTFRLFQFPMGAQLESQRDFFTEKYRDLQCNYENDLEMAAQGMEVDQLPPFHYGSHYSCMGFVVWYLLRLEPFTSLHVWLQDGKFDKPDRLFDSVESTYLGCTTNQADVKELIPEFYCCPEMFENVNRIEFGNKQNSMPIDAVKLPAWARNAHEFVKINRDALESDYVSRHLHHWIDLVFGFKQKPPHMGGCQGAVDACNVFFHLTYFGAVDLDQLKQNDLFLYEQTVKRIDNFGQTPMQLFDKPHPERLPLHEVELFWPIASSVWGADTVVKGEPLPERPKGIVCFRSYFISANPILFICEFETVERLVTVDSTRIFGGHVWQVRQPDVVPPYMLKLDSQALKVSQGVSSGLSGLSSLMGSYNSSTRENRIGVPFASHVIFTDCGASMVMPLVQRTKADGSVEVVSNKQLFEEEEAARMRRRAKVMQTGGSTRDSTRLSAITEVVNQSPVQSTLQGTTPVQSPSVNSSDGTSGSLMGGSRQRRTDENISTQLFASIPSHKLLLSCGHWDHSFKVSTVGQEGCRLIQSIWYHQNVVSCIATTSDFDRNWVVTGSRDCTVAVWEVFPDRTDGMPINLQPLHVLYGHDDVVSSVAINAEFDIVVSGSEDGTIIIHSLRDGSYVRSIIVGQTPVSMSPSAPISKPVDNRVRSDSAPEKFTGLAKPGNDITSGKKRVHWIGISRDAFIVIYSNDGNLLFSYTLNGRIMAIREAGERLHAFCLSDDGKVILTGGDRCLLSFRWVRTLDMANDGPRTGSECFIDGSQKEEDIEPFMYPIRSICLTIQERHLIVGLENGEMRILAQDSDYLRRRLHLKLMEIGILPQSL